MILAQLYLIALYGFAEVLGSGIPVFERVQVLEAAHSYLKDLLGLV